MNLPGWKNMHICLTNQISFLEEEKGGSNGGQAAQLPEAKQGSRGLAESMASSRWCLHWDLLASPVCLEPLQWASEMKLLPLISKVQKDLEAKMHRVPCLTGKVQQSDRRSLDNSYFPHVHSTEPLPPESSPFRSHDLGSFTSYLQAAVSKWHFGTQASSEKTYSSTLRGSEQ